VAEINIKVTDDLRRAMGTLPDQGVELKTEFHRGVEGIAVQLLDWPTRPYRALFDMATSTWGKKIDKWPDVSPENRHRVVKAVLDYKSLPNAMEAISFTFGIEGLSRSAFDQIARARIGSVFASMGWRDNDHSDAAFRIPEALWKDEAARVLTQVTAITEKRAYHTLVATGQHNWQNARSVMGIFFEHRFSCAFNYLALRNFCAKRLKFCEQEDTVATAWLMRERVREMFPLLGEHLVPGCDNKGRCDYHEAESMSEAFGCLFRGCGRWPDPYPYSTFNESCSDEQTIANQARIAIPHGPTTRETMQQLNEYRLLQDSDKARFEGEG
jgi:thymidylate synthase ThyX